MLSGAFPLESAWSAAHAPEMLLTRIILTHDNDSYHAIESTQRHPGRSIMPLHLVDSARDDAHALACERLPVPCAVQFIYLYPLRGALALGGVDGVDGVSLASAYALLPQNPSSRWRVRLFDQHHHLIDERPTLFGMNQVE